MLSSTTRLVVGIVAVVLMVAGLGLIAIGPTAGVSGFWLTVTGAAVLVSLAIERNRYRSEEADSTFEPVGPGGGEPRNDLEGRFRPTDETFVDPTSGHRMRVYLDRRTGERRYVAEA
ncbi:MAG TPA: hypothetical protein VFY18_12685 [Candidatus Limnocylindrales bacterium]|nr:hypothetical protein [Candidatus Limnocylindrales bacterium]